MSENFKIKAYPIQVLKTDKSLPFHKYLFRNTATDLPLILVYFWESSKILA